MKINKRIKIKNSVGDYVIAEFGFPNNDKELKEMYKLRNDVYIKKNYIDKNYYQSGLDIDKYDKENKCVYFIAKINNQIIATARLIKDKYLPTEKDCFDFQEPEQIKKINRSRRAEISRLIVIHPHGYFLPRHLIMFGIFDEICNYCLNNNIEGGYGFIKDKLKDKLLKIKAPIYFIENFKQKYRGELLYRYFNNPSDPVWPIYYLTNDFYKYLKIIKIIFFKKKKENFFKLRLFSRLFFRY